VRYKVKLQKSDEGYAVWCPNLPGCWSQGNTEAEALENIKDAIQAYLETVNVTLPDKLQWLPDKLQWLPNKLQWLPDKLQWLPDKLQWLPDKLRWLAPNP
jgi:predicted RNase H-like HicB family nuclease